MPERSDGEALFVVLGHKSTWKGIEMAGDTHATNGVGVPGVNPGGAVGNISDLTNPALDLANDVTDAGEGGKITADAIKLANEIKKRLGQDDTRQ
ncbi:hypothetical protein [Streptomyces sp. NPDC088748]|uniref:hypothetical protein n=1 Tax=Streptomyces sp. NPDC088748 TaxID=3365887 RepID=UPI00382B8CFF